MPTVLKSGSLNLLEPSKPGQPCNGITLPILPPHTGQKSYTSTPNMKLVHSFETSGNFYCTILSHCTRHYLYLHALIYLVQYKLTALPHAYRTTIYCTHAHTLLTFINKVQQGDREAVLHEKISMFGHITRHIWHDSSHNQPANTGRFSWSYHFIMISDIKTPTDTLVH